MQEGEGELAETKIKSKASKKSSNVPLNELGFRQRVYSDLRSYCAKIKKRTKYCVKQELDNKKECLMSRLTFFIEPHAVNFEELSKFKAIKKSEWEKIKQIVYRTREEVYCCICLEKQMVAPQMTSCGHVFCWSCIYMHYFKSLKATNCPICNEYFTIDALVTCRIIHQKSIKESLLSNIKFTLRVRKSNDNKIYNPETLEEEINFARIVKITKEGIHKIYQQENSDILALIQSTKDQQIANWIHKTLELSDQKLKLLDAMEIQRYKTFKNEKKLDDVILSILSEKETDLISFYQESSGRLMFLHPLCEKYLKMQFGDKLPCTLESSVLLWEETEYSTQLMKKSKTLGHLPFNQEIDLIIINLDGLISEELMLQFYAEVESYNIRKIQLEKKEERESERLNLLYEQEQNYLKKLKKMEESEFYDIRVPTTLDMSQINNSTLFPSLINSQISETKIDAVQKKEEKKFQKKQLQILKVVIDDDFPVLFVSKSPEKNEEVTHTELEQIELQKKNTNQIMNDFPQFSTVMSIGKTKSEEPSGQKKVKGKRKKEKFVDVTSQFFRRESYEDDYY